MPGLVVIEGPDGCGKTTLANKLLQKEAGDYIHLGYVDDIWPYQTKKLWEAVEHCHERLVVIDRHWPSEQVYAKVYRNGSIVAHNARAMDRVIRKHAGLYVFALPMDGNNVEARFNKLRSQRDEMFASGMYSVWKKFSDLYGGCGDGHTSDYAGDIAYAQGGMMHRADVMRYDMDVQTSTQGANEVLARLSDNRAYQYQPALRPCTWNLAGHLRGARVLFVGERPSMTKIDLTREPWHATPFYGNVKCSAYLNNMLHRNRFDETTAMWTNAFANDGVNHLGRLVDLGLVPIALGRKALRKVAEVATGEYYYLPHPAYWQRFRYSQVREYSYLLDKIMTHVSKNEERRTK